MLLCAPPWNSLAGRIPVVSTSNRCQFGTSGIFVGVCSELGHGFSGFVDYVQTAKVADECSTTVHQYGFDALWFRQLSCLTEGQNSRHSDPQGAEVYR